jgi:hypothetical protein
VGDLLELAPVEEDPPAPLALLDVDAPPLDGVHTTLTLRTDHPASVPARREVPHVATCACDAYLEWLVHAEMMTTM